MTWPIVQRSTNAYNRLNPTQYLPDHAPQHPTQEHQPIGGRPLTLPHYYDLNNFPTYEQENHTQPYTIPL